MDPLLARKGINTGAVTFVIPYVFFTPSGALAAHIHRDVEDLLIPQPTVLVTGSWLTVKEQMPDRYAAELAARGFTAVTFDFSGFGESPGTPGQAELPARKIAEITAVADALTTCSFTAGRIGQLAVCASAQYTLGALSRGAPIAAYVSVAGWFHDTATVAPFYGGEDGVRLRLERARDALDTYRTSGQVETVPAYEQDDERAAMFLPLPYYATADRGAIPAWRNEMAELSWLYWLTFDGLTGAESVATPSLFVHSDDCVLPDNVRSLASRMPSADLIWGDGAQIDFYDQGPQVTFAVEAAERHFRTHLTAL